MTNSVINPINRFMESTYEINSNDIKGKLGIPQNETIVLMVRGHLNNWIIKTSKGELVK